jgi:hypothetical protein
MGLAEEADADGTSSMCEGLGDAQAHSARRKQVAEKRRKGIGVGDCSADEL